MGKMDFSSAKRHYKLAAEDEAPLVAAVALGILMVHRGVVTIQSLLSKHLWIFNYFVDETRTNSNKTKMDVIWSHIFSLDSLVIVALLVSMLFLVRCRRS